MTEKMFREANANRSLALAPCQQVRNRPTYTNERGILTCKASTQTRLLIEISRSDSTPAVINVMYSKWCDLVQLRISKNDVQKR